MREKPNTLRKDQSFFKISIMTQKEESEEGGWERCPPLYRPSLMKTYRG